MRFVAKPRGLAQEENLMAQTEQASILTSAHDPRLNKLMVRNKTVMRRLNG